MYDLSDPIAVVKNIGPKSKELLHKLEIYTIEDLIYHFPFRYDDFNNIKKIKDIEENETVTLLINIDSIQNIFTKNAKRLTKAKISDETGTLEAIWFNSHYLKKTLKPDSKYFFSGKITLFANKPTIIAPQMEEYAEDKQNLHTGRLVPIYPETAGITSKWIRSKIYDVLDKKVFVEEFLPKKIVFDMDFPALPFAFDKIHFPKDDKEKNISRKRFQFEELFLEMLNVEKVKKERQKGAKSIKINSLLFEKDLKELETKLPFDLSDTQKYSIEQIKKDLKNELPMNRLLNGDVGSGKTFVALFSAYLCLLNNHNVLYMAPTEILARQHFETFSKYLGDKVNLVVSNEKHDIPEKGIFIGTHALLFEERFTNVGLVIVDEQHRFGVEQRTKLLHINKNETAPHLLSMSATPIPRSLALTLFGDLDISHLEIPETIKKDITTKVIPETKREEAFKWVKNLKQQVFLVCPFIETSEVEGFENVKAALREFENLKNGVFKDMNVGILHGRMKKEEKIKAIDDFKKGITQILVSTPVIEVGVDIPDASVIIIESAERYGLASLHQLRGRVGRRGQESHCLLFMSENTRSAYDRLKHLESVSDGMALAEIDLRNRGHGDLYGTMQSGFKKFRIANLFDVELLEKAKEYAQEFLEKLPEFPLLEKQLKRIRGEYIGLN